MTTDTPVNLAAVMTSLGVIEVTEVPYPEPGPRGVIVQVQAVGVCGSDTAYFQLGRIGDYVVSGPMILGHEAAGRVVAVSDGVSQVEVGDRVAIEPSTPCRDCHQCLAGRYHLCPRLEFLATPPYDGALVQYLGMDERNLFVLPESMTVEDGAMLEPLSVGLWACHRAGMRPGDTVLVTGAGPVGLMAAEAARALGAVRVTVTDPSDHRLSVAATLGSSVESSTRPGADRFDVLIECSGAAGALAAGLARLRENGRAAMVGIPKQAVELPLSQLTPQELSISLVNRYAHTWPTGIALVSAGRVDVRTLVTHRFGLEQTAEALVAAKTIPTSIKAIIDPQQLIVTQVE